MPAFDFITTGQQVIATEQAALETLKPFINQNFQQACQLILDCTSRVVVMGMGKSGHIGNKIAATSPLRVLLLFLCILPKPVMVI
jgi:arabinose-5-phosphate isomerase